MWNFRLFLFFIARPKSVGKKDKYIEKRQATGRTYCLAILNVTLEPKFGKVHFGLSKQHAQM